MATPDPCALFLSALHEDREKIDEIVFEKMKESSRLALLRIPDAGMSSFNDNKDKIEYRSAFQAFTAYQELDDDPKALVNGTMNGRDCTGDNDSFAVEVNEQDPNACHDSCLLDFGQGFRIRSSKIYRHAVTTPVVCAWDYIRMGPEHVRGYFEGFQENFTRYGVDNFEANLLNMVITFGEANASVNSLGVINLTTGGWDAPPKYRLSIPFLRRYRQAIIREGGLGETGLLDIETTRQDALDAIQKDIEVKSAAGNCCAFSMDIKPFEDVRGAYYTREGIVYEGIRFIFNEEPVRGYFRPSNPTAAGDPTYTFVRVYPWINEVNEDGGLSWQPNHSYDACTIECNGVTYPMVSLAFNINPMSFKRYGLGKPMRHMGDNAGANFETVVLDKSYIDCNDYNDKFRLAARHMFRLRADKPELSGAIAYLHCPPCDYAFNVCTTALESADPAPSGPEDLGPCPQDGCCDDGAAADAGQFELQPCGTAAVVWNGTTFDLVIQVERTGGTDGAASVELTPSGLSTATPATGANALKWADGEGGFKEAKFPLVAADVTAGAIATDGTINVEMDGATGASVPAGACTTFNVHLIDATA